LLRNEIKMRRFAAFLIAQVRGIFRDGLRWRRANRFLGGFHAG
jgi:hypothetical protein